MLLETSLEYTRPTKWAFHIRKVKGPRGKQSLTYQL